jgi:hypothetical protein
MLHRRSQVGLVRRPRLLWRGIRVRASSADPATVALRGRWLVALGLTHPTKLLLTLPGKTDRKSHFRQDHKKLQCPVPCECRRGEDGQMEWAMPAPSREVIDPRRCRGAEAHKMLPLGCGDIVS